MVFGIAGKLPGGELNGKQTANRYRNIFPKGIIDATTRQGHRVEKIID
jgi:hypothetical protein